VAAAQIATEGSRVLAVLAVLAAAVSSGSGDGSIQLPGQWDLMGPSDGL